MDEELGRRLRSAREEQRLSLRAVATAVGISPSLLSQVETGKTHPSVSTLYALVNHLDISLDDVMGRPEAGSGSAKTQRPVPLTPVQRAADNPSIEMEDGVRWERLAVGRDGLVDPLLTTYAPGASSSADGRLMRHSGIEYGLILEGTLILKLDFDEHVLGPGDSLCFDSSRPHLYTNPGTTPAKGVWFVIGRTEMLQHAPRQAASGDAFEAITRMHTG